MNSKPWKIPEIRKTDIAKFRIKLTASTQKKFPRGKGFHTFTLKKFYMDHKTWLQEKIAEEAGILPGEVLLDEDFKSYNIDSLSMVSIAFDLETLLGKEISPTIFSEFNTINKLSEWLESQK